MPYDYSKLDGLITEKCKTRYNFAKEIGLSERTVSLKMNGKICWTQKEIATICEKFNIADADIPLYFFNMKVQ